MSCLRSNEVRIPHSIQYSPFPTASGDAGDDWPSYHIIQYSMDVVLGKQKENRLVTMFTGRCW